MSRRVLNKEASTQGRRANKRVQPVSSGLIVGKHASSGIVVPSTTRQGEWVPARSPEAIVKKRGVDALRFLYAELVQTMGRTGHAAAVLLHEAIGKAVTESFAPDKAPMRNITQGAIKERLDKAAEICLRLVDEGHTVQRIIDEIPRMLVEAFDAAERLTRRANVWGVADGQSMEVDSQYLELDSLGAFDNTRNHRPNVLMSDHEQTVRSQEERAKRDNRKRRRLIDL